MEDNYLEHKFHTDKWEKNCSTCYNERKEVLNKPCGVSKDRSPRKQDWELADQRSTHNSESYW